MKCGWRGANQLNKIQFAAHQWLSKSKVGANVVQGARSEAAPGPRPGSEPEPVPEPGHRRGRVTHGQDNAVRWLPSGVLCV